MVWITPVTTWVAGNGIGFSDLNRIEGDLDYIYNTGIKPNTDNGISIGRAKIFGYQGGAMFGHYDIATTWSTAGLWQSAAGYTGVNAASGQSVAILNNNSNIATFSASAINLLKPTAITGALTVDPTLGITATTTIQLKKPFENQGTTGTISTESSGTSLQFSRPSINVLNMTSVGGNLAVLTNGRSSIAGNYNVVFNADQSTTFFGTVGAVGIDSSGTSLQFTRPSINSLTCTTVGGNLNVLTNGRTSVPGNYSITFNADQTTTIHKDLICDGETNPTTTPTESTISVSGIIPRGQYNFRFNFVSLATDTAILSQNAKIFAQYSNAIVTNTFGGSFYSDGLTTNIGLSVGASITIWKF